MDGVAQRLSGRGQTFEGWAHDMLDHGVATNACGWGSAHGYGIWGALAVAAWTEGGPSSSHQQSTKPEVSALV